MKGTFVELHEILEHLLKSADWSASRSSRAGGQHRDKASTRAELTLTLDSLAGLPSEIVYKLAAALLLKERPLRVVVQDERSLSRNQEIAIERLRERLARALQPPPRPRRSTRPSRASRERRLDEKVRHGQDKRLRLPPTEVD
jgi:ribosome-associated protein